MRVLYIAPRPSSSAIKERQLQQQLHSFNGNCVRTRQICPIHGVAVNWLLAAMRYKQSATQKMERIAMTTQQMADLLLQGWNDQRAGLSLSLDWHELQQQGWQLAANTFLSMRAMRTANQNNAHATQND
jgi:hypothetical protein